MNVRQSVGCEEYLLPLSSPIFIIQELICTMNVKYPYSIRPLGKRKTSDGKIENNKNENPENRKEVHSLT